MDAGLQIANAPCSWGVHFSDRPENLPWPQVMDEAAAAGFSALDLGPVGYLPTDLPKLREELASRGLRLASGVLFDPLWDPAALPAILEKTRRTCAILKPLDAPRLVIIDCISQERGATAGRNADARRLNQRAWDAMMAAIIKIAGVAREEFGVASYLHPHAGSYIEFEDEVDRAMNDLPREQIGLCIDTGHAAYAGIDPVALIHRYGSRLGLMHFKDVNPQIRADCIRNQVAYFDAVDRRQIFCPLGAGMVDFSAVRDALMAVSYRGLAVVEQDPAAGATPLEHARANLEFLRSVRLVSAA